MEYRLSGTVTERDRKQHLPHPFHVPAGATQLTIRYSYTPARVGDTLNALHLSLFDPSGARGAGHRQGLHHANSTSHTIDISAVAATPGYSAGPIQAGEWSLVIDTHMIMADAPVTYQIEITTTDAPVTQQASEPSPPIAPTRGPGWYRGDLHGHTVHSDADWQIADLLASARAFKLDFVTLSDHNTIAGLAEFDRQTRPDLLTMGGIELTTYTGHALALGLRQWVDWRVRPGERSMPQIAEEVLAAGGTFIIAHPMSVGDPICTGCDWGYPDMMPGPACCVEIWNGGLWESESGNENALALWYVWLNQGYRMVGTSGTDVHGQPPEGARPGFNVVYAAELSEQAILAAIRQGHLYVSDGPQLELRATAPDGRQAIMGDQIGGANTLFARWNDAPDDGQIHLIINGSVHATLTSAGQGQHEWALDNEAARWATIELRAPNGHLRAVANPIFF